MRNELLKEICGEIERQSSRKKLGEIDIRVLSMYEL